MTKADTAYITVGKIGSPYGVKGWLKIQSFTEFGASILDYQPWYITNSKNVRETVAIEDGRIHGNGIIVKFPDVNTPEEARLKTGQLIEIERDKLPILPNDEFYWSDLEGLTVIDLQGKILGKVLFVLETGSNDVLIVKGDKGDREHAVPYLVDSVIKKVDLEKREILVDWEII